MDSIVRYRPDPAIRWLQQGATGMREKAARKGESVLKRAGERTLGKDLKQTASAILDVGRSAAADIAHLAAAATSYLLHDSDLEIQRPGASRRIPYRDIRAIRHSGDDFVLILAQGSVKISPPGYVVSGPTKAPIGWERNGMEASYVILAEEIAARAGLQIDQD